MEAAIRRENTAPTRRRENAPIRRARRPATVIPDILLATATAAWAMAAVFFGSTFVGAAYVAGDASASLARVFAATLAIAGVLMFFMAIVLLRDERARADHYRGPMAIGAVVGVVEALLFLNQLASVLFIPPLCLLFAARPLRGLVARLMPGGGGGE